jgi:hypothetical protein
MELAFSQGVVEGFEIFGVVRLDSYKWNSGREWYPIHSYEAKLGQISPTTVQKSKPLGKWVLPMLKRSNGFSDSMDSNLVLDI